MSKKNVIDVLKMENDLILFNPATGEDIPLGAVNELNMRCYNAHLEAIQMLNNSIPIEWLKKHGAHLVTMPKRKFDSSNMAFLFTLIKDWEDENGTENN